MADKKLSSDDQIILYEKLQKYGNDIKKINGLKEFKEYNLQALVKSYIKILNTLGEDDHSNIIQITNIRKKNNNIYADILIDEDEEEKVVKNVYFDKGSIKLQKLLLDYFFNLKKKYNIAQEIFNSIDLDSKIINVLKNNNKRNISDEEPIEKVKDNEEKEENIKDNEEKEENIKDNEEKEENNENNEEKEENIKDDEEKIKDNGNNEEKQENINHTENNEKITEVIKVVEKEEKINSTADNEKVMNEKRTKAIKMVEKEEKINSTADNEKVMNEKRTKAIKVVEKEKKVNHTEKNDKNEENNKMFDNKKVKDGKDVVAKILFKSRRNSNS